MEQKIKAKLELAYIAERPVTVAKLYRFTELVKTAKCPSYLLTHPISCNLSGVGSDLVHYWDQYRQLVGMEESRKYLLELIKVDIEDDISDLNQILKLL